MYHTLTWMLWLAGALLPAMISRNPLYLTLLLLAVAVAYNTIGRLSPMASSWSVFLKAGLALGVLSVVFNTLTSHYGDTVLFTLPRLSLRLGRVPFLELGGATTLEALIYGLTGALSLVAILLVFATFNVLVDHQKVLRMTPAFLYQTGMIASIAIAFVPQMVSSLQDIREAQALRGHRFRGLRDLLPLFVPLLTTGLERSMQLAESMEARGFGGGPSGRTERRAGLHRVLIATALFGLLVAAFYTGYFASARWVGALIGLGSMTLLLVNVLVMGRGVKRSRYRRELWRPRDTAVAAASVASILVVAAFWVFHVEALVFYPYPKVALPDFNPLIGLAMLSAVAPVLAAPQLRSPAHD
jgi:energy-coupling factor transport system permease protein